MTGLHTFFFFHDVEFVLALKKEIYSETGIDTASLPLHKEVLVFV